MKRFIAAVCGEFAGQLVGEMLDELQWPTIVQDDEWCRENEARLLSRKAARSRARDS